jgi:hypothetical protein
MPSGILVAQGRRGPVSRMGDLRTPQSPSPAPALGHFGCPGRTGADRVRRGPVSRISDPRTPQSHSPAPALGHFGCPRPTWAIETRGRPKDPTIPSSPQHGSEDEHSSEPDRASQRGHRKFELSRLAWVPAVRYRSRVLREESLDFRLPDNSLNKRFGRWSVCNFSSSSTMPTDR